MQKPDNTEPSQSISLRQFEDQVEEQRISKLMGMYENQQKYLEMQLSNQQQTNNELQTQINQLKQSNEKYTQRQYEWKEQERIWQSEHNKQHL